MDEASDMALNFNTFITKLTDPNAGSPNTENLSDAVDKLPEGARHVFVLSGIYGYSHEEASKMLGIAVGTSKAQLHRARRLLAQQLEQEGYMQET